MCQKNTLVRHTSDLGTSVSLTHIPDFIVLTSLTLNFCHILKMYMIKNYVSKHL